MSTYLQNLIDSDEVKTDSEIAKSFIADLINLKESFDSVIDNPDNTDTVKAIIHYIDEACTLATQFIDPADITDENGNPVDLDETTE